MNSELVPGNMRTIRGTTLPLLLLLDVFMPRPTQVDSFRSGAPQRTPKEYVLAGHRTVQATIAGRYWPRSLRFTRALVSW